MDVVCANTDECINPITNTRMLATKRHKLVVNFTNCKNKYPFLKPRRTIIRIKSMISPIPDKLNHLSNPKVKLNLLSKQIRNHN